MAQFRTIVKPNMINGIRAYDPVFKPTVKELAKYKPTLWNFTRSDVYKQLLESVDKPPRMHSFFLPKYREIRLWQAEANINNGVPSYLKFPKMAAWYRMSWFITYILFFSGVYKLYLVIQNANYGTPYPDFML